MPFWPFGYAAYAEPFRVVDFDDRPISKTPERQAFGGGSTPDWTNESPPANMCGAAHGWAVSPQR